MSDLPSQLPEGSPRYNRRMVRITNVADVALYDARVAEQPQRADFSPAFPPRSFFWAGTPRGGVLHDQRRPPRRPVGCSAQGHRGGRQALAGLGGEDEIYGLGGHDTSEGGAC